MLLKCRVLQAAGDRSTKIMFEIALTDSVVNLPSPTNELLSMDAIRLEYNSLYVTHQLCTSLKTIKTQTDSIFKLLSPVKSSLSTKVSLLLLKFLR